MRVFISYARVDKPYCVQIVDILDVHQVWYDQRLHAGQQWWDEIRRRIDWCEGFIYLISPESVASEYCRKEFEIALGAAKHIFPVLISPRAVVPDALKHIQYADFTKGLTPEAVKVLLNAIYIAEKSAKPVPVTAAVGAGQVATYNPPHSGSQTANGGFNGSGVAVQPIIQPPKPNPNTLITEVAEAMDKKDYDKVVFLLKQAKEMGHKSMFINLEGLLAQAEAELERQSYLREAERQYTPITAFVKRAGTRAEGCQAFLKFRTEFPDYDPDNLAVTCATEILPMLEWCVIPEGEVTMEYDQKHITYFVGAFKMSKYPVTNAQYQVFIDTADGYSNSKWWDFSSHARQWRSQHPKPLETKSSWGDHPRANVCWYEAMAFSRWLANRSGLRVCLPTEQQWQRASQGDDSRAYPWGSKFDKNRCNTRESKLRTTCAVTKYSNDASPYGVCNMAGNVWEWCNSMDYGKRLTNNSGDADLPRAVRGGSFISVPQRVKNTFHFYLNPIYSYATIGFRVAISGME